jgi:hypothetical protein
MLQVAWEELRPFNERIQRMNEFNQLIVYRRFRLMEYETSFVEASVKRG